MFDLEKIEFSGNQCASLFLSDLTPTIQRGQAGVVYTVTLDAYRDFLSFWQPYLSEHRKHPKYPNPLTDVDEVMLKKSFYLECFRANMCELEVQNYGHKIATPILPACEDFDDLVSTKLNNPDDTANKAMYIYEMLVPNTISNRKTFEYPVVEFNLYVYKAALVLYDKCIHGGIDNG